MNKKKSYETRFGFLDFFFHLFELNKKLRNKFKLNEVFFFSRISLFAFQSKTHRIEIKKKFNLNPFHFSFYSSLAFFLFSFVVGV